MAKDFSAAGELRIYPGKQRKVRLKNHRIAQRPGPAFAEETFGRE